MRHHALREQAGERLLHLQLAAVGQRAGPEAGVEQVQDRVLDTADILIHRQPCGDFGGIERPVRRLAGKAQEIPAGIDECIERVGLALRRAAAFRAGHVLPGRMALQRIARLLRNRHPRAVRPAIAILRHRHHTAGIAMDERNRRAPVSLARNAPVAQAPDRLALRPSLPFGAGDHLCLGSVHIHAIEEIGIDQHALAGLGLAIEWLRQPRPDGRQRRGGSAGHTLLANSKSRWSCPGTAMIAPVP